MSYNSVEEAKELELRGEKQGLTGNTGGPGPLGTRPVEARGAILDKAKAIINGDRQDQYGNPEDNFAVIAELWRVYDMARKGTPDRPHDTAMKMALMKIARIATGVGTEDSYIDACGYIALAADMSKK